MKTETPEGITPKCYRDYYWRDGFLVRYPRTVYIAPFFDEVAAQPLFIAKSTDLAKLIEFNDHAQQVLSGISIRALGLVEAEPLP